MKQWEIEFVAQGSCPELRTAWFCDHGDCEECSYQGEKGCFDSMMKFMESEVKQ